MTICVIIVTKADVYRQFKEIAIIIIKCQLNSTDKATQTDWRIVACAWLLENDLMTIKQYRKVSTLFPNILFS